MLSFVGNVIVLTKDKEYAVAASKCEHQTRVPDSMYKNSVDLDWPAVLTEDSNALIKDLWTNCGCELGYTMNGYSIDTPSGNNNMAYRLPPMNVTEVGLSVEAEDYLKVFAAFDLDLKCDHYGCYRRELGEPLKPERVATWCDVAVEIYSGDRLIVEGDSISKISLKTKKGSIGGKVEFLISGDADLPSSVFSGKCRIRFGVKRNEETDWLVDADRIEFKKTDEEFSVSGYHRINVDLLSF